MHVVVYYPQSRTHVAKNLQNRFTMDEKVGENTQFIKHFSIFSLISMEYDDASYPDLVTTAPPQLVYPFNLKQIVKNCSRI